MEHRGLGVIDGAMALVILLLVVQVWLLSATLDAYLAGHTDAAIPGAIASGVLFLACAALYRLVSRIERQAKREQHCQISRLPGPNVLSSRAAVRNAMSSKDRLPGAL